MDELRQACERVAEQATWVHIQTEAIGAYAMRLAAAIQAPEHANATADPPTADPTPGGADPGDDETPAGDREGRAAYWLTLDAINFGSGWFPTLRKRPGLSGYNTIAAGLRDRFASAGPWSAGELAGIDRSQIAAVTGQEPGHELMGLFAASLSGLGRRIQERHGGSFAAVADAADGSAVTLARSLGEWDCFADSSRYRGLDVAFLKRAQIAAADLHRARVATFTDLPRLTMFADNLVPHVLRLDGILTMHPDLVARIDAEQLIVHGSPEEVEIRACAVHAVELIVAAAGRPDLTAAAVDQHLWRRGQQPHYKASPRHRSRCTAY